MEPTSSGDLDALAPPPPARREATRRASADDPDESTVLDLVDVPDNEPTSIWPMLAGPVAEVDEPRARGSSGRVTRRRTVGKYVLREKLARGAFGVVFSAHDPSLDRDVAIKVLRPTHHANDVIVQRFLHEARATARIAHPGIVTIHDCGQIETNLGETAFIAMELLSGQSLGDRLADVGRLPVDQAMEITRQVASALEAAHRVDVLHRDLKPDNIFLVEDPAMPSGERVKVFDFGLAKLGDHGHTQAESVFGTPHYMSPEQTRSTAQVDHRSDIYALGCILYELLAGRPPFDGSVRTVVEAHQGVTPPRISASLPDLAPAIDELIAAMLAKDPLDRPQTMGSVQRELQRITGRAPSQPAIRPSQPPLAEASRPHAFPHHEASRPHAPQHAEPSRPCADADVPRSHALGTQPPVAHELGSQPPIALGSQPAHPLHAAAPGTLRAPLQVESMMHPGQEPTPMQAPPPVKRSPRTRPPTPSPIVASASSQLPPGVAGPPSGVLLVPPTHTSPAVRPAAPRQTRRLALYAAITASLITLAIVLALITTA